MTDKQIIIHDVDVSECEYIIPPHEQCPNKPMPYAKETSCFACKEHNTKLNFCKNNPNCYYKNWKRKEQECEELNKTITNLENIRDEFSTKLDQLKAENIKFTLDSKKLVAQYSAKLKRLRQTLTEIKELCKKESGWVNCSDNMPTETAIFAEQILQKISEVEQ